MLLSYERFVFSNIMVLNPFVEKTKRQRRVIFVEMQLRNKIQGAEP